MAETIYGKNGTAKATAKSVRYTGQFMGVPQLEVEIDGPLPLGLEVGDYIVFSYDGIKYSIMDLPSVTKQASAGSAGDAFVYDSVVFKSPLGVLANIDFLDTVLNENDVHYSTLPVFEFYGTVKNFADRLQANINRLYTGWKVSVEGYDDSTNPNYDTLHEYNNISISNIKCSDSLSIPYETWGITYVFMVDAQGNNCIVFNHALDSTSAKRYGKGNGLYSLTKRMSTEKPVTNRLRAYGSTDNLPARYYNNLDGIDEGIYLPNLMIPRSKWKNQNDPITAYIDSTDIDENDTSMSRYGVREKSIYFDGSNDTEKIEPTIKGVTAGMIRAVKEEMGDTSNVPSATLYPDDERMDKILSCENPDDDGLTREGEKLYSTSIDFNIIKGNDITQATYSITTNENDTFRRFSVQAEIETDLTIGIPATYRINEKNNSVGNSPIMSIADSKYGSITWEGSVKSGYMDYAKMDVVTVDESGNENICAKNIQLTWEVNTHVVDGQNKEMLDIFFAGGAANDIPAYFSIPYKGTVKFRIYISGACYFSTGAFAKLRAQMHAISMIASRGALIQEKTFRVYIKQIGFNIEDYASTEEAKLVVNSGPCAGRSFNIKKNSVGTYLRSYGSDIISTHVGWFFECFRSLDESLNQYFPNNIFTIDEGDEFVLTGLEMPDLYVQMASQKLYDEAVKWLWKHKDGLEVFDLDINNKVAYLDSVKIKEGMLLPLYDENLNVGSETENEEGETVITYDCRIIDSVTIEIGEEPIPVIAAVLREEKEESVFKSLRKTVQNISRRTTQNVIRMQVFNIAEEVVRNNAPAQSPAPGDTINSADFVTLHTEQTITGRKTFAEDVVFGADGGKMYVPSATPGTYDLFINPSVAIPEDPNGPAGISGWDEWPDSQLSVPLGFHMLSGGLLAGQMSRGHIYFDPSSGLIYVAYGASVSDLKTFGSSIQDIMYSNQSKTITVTKGIDPSVLLSIDLSELSPYLLNGVFANLSETSSDAEIKSAIGSYDGLRQAIIDKRVIIDNYDVDYENAPTVILQAIDGGNENFISLSVLSAGKYQSIIIERDADGTLSVSGKSETSWLNDGPYGQLDTGNKTVLGAINELHGGMTALKWAGRIDGDSVTKTGGSAEIQVTRQSEGTYAVAGLPAGCVVSATPLTYSQDGIIPAQGARSISVAQNASTGDIAVYTYGGDGTPEDFGFSLIAM